MLQISESGSICSLENSTTPKSGIMDRTDLRFFTKFIFLGDVTLIWIKTHRGEIYSNASRSSQFLFLTHLLGRLIHYALDAFVGLWIGLLAYQFVARTEILLDEDGS